MIIKFQLNECISMFLTTAGSHSSKTASYNHQFFKTTTTSSEVFGVSSAETTCLLVKTHAICSTLIQSDLPHNI